jgi:hypothetical protein
MDCYEDGISFTRKHKGLQDLFQDGENDADIDPDTVDPNYEKYLQDDFQDKIVEDVFLAIARYVDSQAVPICEYLTRDDIEVLINELEKD